MTLPSTTGPIFQTPSHFVAYHQASTASWNLSVESPCRQATAAAPVYPLQSEKLRNFVKVWSAGPPAVLSQIHWKAALCISALPKSGSLGCPVDWFTATSWCRMLPPPADSPNTVTPSLLPPKRPMYFCTNCSIRYWSPNPALAVATLGYSCTVGPANQPAWARR